MFEAIARFSVRFRWLIIIFWIAAVPVVSMNFPDIGSVTKNDNSDFLPKNSPLIKATSLENNFQPKGTAGTLILVAVSNSGPINGGSNEAAIKRVSAAIQKVDGVNSVKNQGVSADGRAEQLQVGLDGKVFGPQAQQIVDGVRAQTGKDLPAGLQLHVTGDIAAGIDAEKANEKGRNNTELYTVIFILALLLFVFRAVLAPLTTLIPAGLALAIAQPIIAESTKIGVEVSFITQILLIVLVLGAGTDYGLFLVFRVREELRKGREPKEAVIHALSKVGESITFSAATVVVALLSLLLATFGIYKGLGPALAIALAIMLLVALTFLPALLAVLGRAVFWPSKTRGGGKPKIGLWGRLADKVIKRPVTMLVIGILLLGGLSFGILGYKTTGFTNGSAPAGSDSAAGQQALQQHFPAANLNPQLLLLRFDQPVWNKLSSVQQVQTSLAGSGLFKAVSGPFSANGFNVSPAQLQALHETGGDNPTLQAISQFISPDGRIVQFYGISNAGVPGGTAATNQTPKVRAELSKVASQVGAADSGVFSNEAAAYDINRIANNDLKRIIPIVLLLIAVLLAILVRSLVAPWYLIATVGLSYLATLGFSMLVFVHLGHQDGLNFVLPFMIFIFSMALGEDYNILVISRIREEAHKEKTLFAAVTKAVGVTGTTVTSAGLILAGTFGVLGLVGGNQQVEQIGYGIAFGVILDTFFVRTLLVPSIVTLLGRWNWWPSKLYQESK